jgi:hypothetical protein
MARPITSLLPKSRQTRLIIMILAVALPALALAGTGIWLTLRVANQVRTESGRFNQYIAGMLPGVFERELVERMQAALVNAEAVSRTGGSADEIRAALASRAQLFEAPQFVPLERLDGYSLVTVEGHMLIYGSDATHRRRHPFAAMLLNGPDGYSDRRRRLVVQSARVHRHASARRRPRPPHRDARHVRRLRIDAAPRDRGL